VASFLEHGNEPSGFIEVGNFLSIRATICFSRGAVLREVQSHNIQYIFKIELPTLIYGNPSHYVVYRI
jgi:hypothetical protein